jgi:drug/metabolite transporter (DMT)-like permease
MDRRGGDRRGDARVDTLAAPGVVPPFHGDPDAPGGGVLVFAPGRAIQGLHSILTTFAMILGALVPGALYWVLARKAARRPERAKRVLLASAAVLAALSAWWYAVSWDYGLRYQGIGFIYLNLALGAAAVIGMGVIAVCWRSRPSPVLPMLFLWIEFVWALGCAFPWLGDPF